jgi:20S proteasome alpha/beta subunit
MGTVPDAQLLENLVNQAHDIYMEESRPPAAETFLEYTTRYLYETQDKYNRILLKSNKLLIKLSCN